MDLIYNLHNGNEFSFNLLFYWQEQVIILIVALAALLGWLLEGLWIDSCAVHSLPCLNVVLNQLKTIHNFLFKLWEDLTIGHDIHILVLLRWWLLVLVSSTAYFLFFYFFFFGSSNGIRLFQSRRWPRLKSFRWHLSIINRPHELFDHWFPSWLLKLTNPRELIIIMNSQFSLILWNVVFPKYLLLSISSFLNLTLSSWAGSPSINVLTLMRGLPIFQQLRLFALALSGVHILIKSL